MNTTDLINSLQRFKENIENIHLHFIERIKSNQKYNYEIFKPEISKELNDELSDLSFVYLERILIGKDLANFDPTLYEDGTIEYIDIQEIPSLLKMKNIIDKSVINHPKNIDDMSFERIWALCIVVENIEGEKVYLFKKYSPTKVLKKGLIQAIFMEGTLDKFDNKVIPIEGRFDAFSFGDNLYILNRFYFEQIFSFNDKYYSLLEEGLNALKTQDIIEGFDDFKEACLDSNKIAKKFAKIMSKNGIETFWRNIGNIPQIIKDFQLNVQFVDGRIVYDGKEGISDIIKLLSNEFVEAALDGGRYEAKNLKPR